MDIALWIVLGGLAGWIVSMVMRTTSRRGMLMDIVLGVLGAFVGGVLMNFFGSQAATGFTLYSLGVAIVGAMALIWLGRVFQRSI